MLDLKLPEPTPYPAAVFDQAGRFVLVGHHERCETEAMRIGGLYCWIDSITGRPFIRHDYEEDGA